MFALIFGLSFLANAQDVQKNQPKGYQFTDIKRLPATSVKDQARAGTCWSWSGISFFESEMIRMGKEPIDLSAMYIVRHAYSDKATKFVRLHGSMNFAVGGAFCDVMHVIKNYGIVPMDVYKGLNYGEPNHAFGEIDDVLAGYINAVIKNSNKKLSTAWKKGFDGILDAYLGEEPEKFEYKGKEYTPRTFADEVVGLNMDDYVSLTSFTHHPFYSQFAIEIQDNWRNGLSYNLPIDEFMAVMDNAVKKGYTFAWGSDVSEQGFTRDGIAVMPDINKESELSGSDMARWTGLTTANKRQIMTTKPHPEINVTQEMRQVAFDNWETTDDHGMVIYGIAKDQNGKEYFMVKNSWGKSGKYNGIWYASKAFVAYKTMNILVHKDALPKEIAKKLGIK